MSEARWTPDELERLGGAVEIGISSLREDGTLRKFIIVWVVRHAESLYVRAAYGPDTPWYGRALRSGRGRIRGGGLERDVSFEVPGPELAEPLNAAYHAKYDRYGARFVGTVVSDDAVRLTLRLDPR